MGAFAKGAIDQSNRVPHLLSYILVFFLVFFCLVSCGVCVRVCCFSLGVKSPGGREHVLVAEGSRRGRGARRVGPVSPSGGAVGKFHAGPTAA